MLKLVKANSGTEDRVGVRNVSENSLHLDSQTLQKHNIELLFEMQDAQQK